MSSSHLVPYISNVYLNNSLNLYGNTKSRNEQGEREREKGKEDRE